MRYSKMHLKHPRENIEQFSRNRRRYAKMRPWEHDIKTVFSVVTIIVIPRTPAQSFMREY